MDWDDVDEADLHDKWCELVDKYRADPRFQYAKYHFMANIRTDLDSVWDNRNKAAVHEREKRGIIFDFGCPTDSRKKARGEKSIRDAEMAMKALMVEYRLPIQWWPLALMSARDSRRLWPIERSVKAPDGDAPTPWETATEGRVSHAMVLESINKFVPVGALAALGNTKHRAVENHTQPVQNRGKCSFQSIQIREY